MSHLSKIKTQFKDKETLISTLRGLGCTVVEGKNLKLDMKWRIDGNKHEEVDFIINVDELKEKNFMGCRYNEGSYEIIGDAYAVRDKTGKLFKIDEFIGNAKSQYAEKEITRQFSTVPELAQFDLVNREIDKASGDVVLTFQRWS